MTNHILFTSWYSGLGGGETDLLALAAALPQHNMMPHLLLARAGALGDRWKANGWPVHILRFRGASTYFVPQLWAQFPVVERMAKLLREENIDLIHADYHTLPMIAPAAKRAEVPVCWTVHGWWFHPKPWQRFFFRQFPAVARSVAIRDGFLGDPPFMPEDRLPVVYSGVDTVRFHPEINGAAFREEINLPEDVPTVALIARFQPVKGHHTFQQMAKLVLREVPDAHFIIAGEDTFGVAKDDAYKRDILQAAENDPLLRERLHYIGFREDVERVMAAADVVVCTSEFESYGKVNLEAMACGVPVVSTNKGGPTETVAHGESGFLVPSGDAAAFAERVIFLLKHPDERTQLGIQGRERVETLFSESAATEAYLDLFKKTLAD